MPKKPDLTEALLNSWKTVNEVSVYLIRSIDPELWDRKIPGYPRKTIGMLLVHLHNIRCMWIKEIDKEKITRMPTRLDPKRATRDELLNAMKLSNEAMLALFERCIGNGGKLPARPAWLNFPNDVMHLFAYIVAHEAHHRGQIMMAMRQLGQPLPRNVTGEFWQWTRRHRESGKS